MRIALAAGALLVALLAGEALLRWLDLPGRDACDTTADYAIADDALGFRGAPGALVSDVRLNARGLRGPLLPATKPPGEQRLLFLGDSTCWGLGVALGESFGSLATERLALPGARFVLGAFPGYSSYHSRAMLEELLPLEPDLVVLYVGARNDGSRARYYPDADIPSRRARLHATWHDVRVLRAIEAAVDRSYRSLFRKLRSAPDRARVPPEAFRENVTAMLERLRALGIPAAIVVPPLSERFEADEPQQRLYRDVLEEVARARAVPVVRVAERFAAHDETTLYFEDGFHLSAAGHALVGEEIAQVIEGERLLRPSTAR